MILFLGKYPLKTWKIPSRTEKDPDLGIPIERTVELLGDGRLFCDCPAGYYRHKCHHINDIKKELETNFGGITNAVEHYRQEKKNENQRLRNSVQ